MAWQKEKNSISIATFSWWHENRLCWAHDAWRSTTTWNENINRMYASDNWNEEKRQPRSIALLYGNAHFDVFVPPIINGANIHSEPINMPTYRSLLFAPFHVWLFHAIGHFFCFVSSISFSVTNEFSHFLFLAQPLPYLVATWILFTLQLGPNNPNKWTNWEITSMQRTMEIDQSLEMSLAIVIAFLFSYMQSSPSFIWASCHFDQCACKAQRFFHVFSYFCQFVL